MRSSTLTVSLLTIAVAQGATISSNARCGSNFGGATCLGSRWGNCCSQYNYCGSTQDYCAPAKGCQSQFGTCNPVSSSTQRSSSSTPIIVSPSSTRSSSASASPTQRVSTNARCGAGFGSQTCKGSKWGNCCSQFFYCGSTDAYCGPQSCQKGYGDCNSVSSSSSVARSSSTSSSIVSSSSSIVSSSSSIVSSSSSIVSSSSSIVSSSSSIVSSSSSQTSSPITPSSTIASSSPVSSSSATPSPSETPDPTICAAKGLPGPDAFNYDANFNINAQACLQSCVADSRCKSTGFYLVTDPGSGTQTGTCRKYDKSVTRSADIGVGYYTFSDKICGGPSPSSSSVSTSLSSSVTPSSSPSPSSPFSSTLPVSSSTTGALVTPTPSASVALTCNAQGQAPARDAYYRSDMAMSQANCIQNCLTLARCQSTGWVSAAGSSSAQCLYYEDVVSNIADLSAGNRVYNDKACGTQSTSGSSIVQSSSSFSTVASTPTPSATTLSTSASPTPSATPLCGVSGNYPQTAQFYVFSSTEMSLGQCVQSCIIDDACKSTYWEPSFTNPTVGRCFYFSVPVSATRDPTGTGRIIYNDKACSASQTPTPPVVTVCSSRGGANQGVTSLSSTDGLTLASCIQSCSINSSCQSSSWRPTSGDLGSCMLFAFPVANTQSSTNGNIIFNDRTCPVPAQSSSSSAASSQATPTPTPTPAQQACGSRHKRFVCIN